MTTKNSKNLKPWQQKPEQEPDNDSSSIDEIANSLKPPKLRSRNKGLAEKLDELMAKKADHDDLKKLPSKDDFAKLHDDVSKSRQDVHQQLADQSSKVVKAVSDARDIGFNDGLGQRVDTLSQKYDGLETNINLREQKLDEKTQQYIAKLADLDQVGRYLQKYTVTVNDGLVPTLRALIQAVERGITHHTSQVTHDVYQQLQQDSGLTVKELVKSSLYQDFSQQRHDAQEASLSAKLYEKATREDVKQISAVADFVVQYLSILAIELVVMITLVLLTPGWWKLVMVLPLIAFSMYDVALMRREGVKNVL